jgi:hypothetical protein
MRPTLIRVKHYILIAICLGFAAIRIFQPQAIVDGNTVWLLVIATVVLIGPDLKVLLPYIKRIKIGDTEIELAEATAKMVQELERVKEEVRVDENWEIPDRTTGEVNEVLNDAKTDPRAAFLLLATKIEEEVRSQLQKANLSQSRQFTSLPRLVEFGVQREIFPVQVLSIFKDFWYARNKVAHGQAADIDHDTILSLIAVGTDILKLVSIEKK